MKSRWIVLSFVSFLLPSLFAEEILQQKTEDLLEGEHWAICYSAYRKGQHPDQGSGAKNPSEAEIIEDLKILSHEGAFKLIRLYDSGENAQTVLRLLKEHKIELRVMLGAWLDAEVNNPDCPFKPEPYSEEELRKKKKKNEVEVANLIKLANEYPKIVQSVAVGNECLVIWNDHMVPVDSVIAYVKQVKASVKQPVTVADNYDWWAKHGEELAKELDFVSVHIYPVWEGKTIDEAMAFGKENMEAVRKALPESKLVITEAGWATTASEFGERAGEKQQERYYQELFEWTEELNITTFFFEAFDESWKGDPGNAAGAEKHWGIFTEERKPKLVMKKQFGHLVE